MPMLPGTDLHHGHGQLQKHGLCKVFTHALLTPSLPSKLPPSLRRSPYLLPYVCPNPSLPTLIIRSNTFVKDAGNLSFQARLGQFGEVAKLLNFPGHQYSTTRVRNPLFKIKYLTYPPESSITCIEGYIQKLPMTLLTCSFALSG